MVLVMIILVLLSFSGWILFMPLVLSINTTRAEYQLYQHGTIRFSLSPDLQPQLRVFGISIPVRRSKKSSQPKSTTRKKKSAVSFHHLRTLLTRIFRSITLNRFYLDLDTDDVVMNAKLVPVFILLSRGPVQLSTNFEGRIYANLQAKVKLYSVAWAFFLFFTKK